MSSRLRVCASTDLVRGVVKVVDLAPELYGTPREAMVLRDRAGVARAYVNRCQHLPVPLDGGSRDFLGPDGVHLLCGTHGALYRPEDGLCVEGPCETELLEGLTVVETAGEIVLEDPLG